MLTQECPRLALLPDVRAAEAPPGLPTLGFQGLSPDFFNRKTPDHGHLGVVPLLEVRGGLG